MLMYNTCSLFKKIIGSCVSVKNNFQVGTAGREGEILVKRVGREVHGFASQPQAR